MYPTRSATRLHLIGKLAPVLMFLGVIGLETVWGAPPPELKKLHALLVVDTNAGLGESVEIDGHRIEMLLKNNIPAKRLELKILKGKDVTADKILKYYQSLRVDRSDGLFFYYAGHGATDPGKGHFLALQELKVTPLIRSTLVQTMEKTRAGLVVVLTDCCSSRYKLNMGTLVQKPPHIPVNEPTQVFRCLLFQHRGVVDITAATYDEKKKQNEAAYGDENQGGIFTRTLGKLLSTDLKLLDKNKDGFVSWEEFFPVLESETQKTFTKWSEVARGKGEKVDQKTQQPHRFRLPGRDLNEDVAGTVYAVVGLRNLGKEAVRFEYRWSGDEPWKNGTMPAKDTTCLHTKLASDSGELPKLEVRVAGEKDTVKLEPNRWTGTGTPTFEDGKKYRFDNTTKKRGLPDMGDTDAKKPPSK